MDQDSVLQEFGIEIANVVTTTQEPTFRHSFSHYHLDITPTFVQIAQLPTAVADNPRQLWYDLGASNVQLGLAKPAVTLLGRLRQK